MTSREYETAYKELMAGWSGHPRKVFGQLLGYVGKMPHQEVGAKIRGERAPSPRDVACIRLLRIIKKLDGHLMRAIAEIPEYKKELEAFQAPKRFRVVVAINGEETHMYESTLREEAEVVAEKLRTFNGGRDVFVLECN